MRPALDRFADRGRGLGALAVAAVLALSAVVGAFAQEATPVPTGEEGLGGPFPAHIHQGTCDNLDPNPAYPLNDVVYGGLSPESLATDLNEATPVAAQLVGAGNYLPVASSVSALDVPITEFYVGGVDYSINVHASAEDAETYIACGEIGGPLRQPAGATRTEVEGSNLLIGLRPQNDSGYTGVAWLRATSATTTEVTVFLIAPFDAAAMATPAA